MEIKLININKIFSFFLLCFFASCKISNEKYFKNFKQEFKFQAYCSCIIQGYNDKSLTSKMILIDKSFYSPILNNVFSKELYRIGNEEAKIMKLDSINSIKTVSEASAGKKIIFHCLNFYNSQKLDSIANAKEKEWKNIKNKDSIIENNAAF